MKNSTRKILSGAAGAMMAVTAVAQVATAEVGYGVSVNEDARAFDTIANVQGTFSFDQETVTPADEVFNLFGTVVTGMCAKPDFAIGTGKTDYFVNIGGKFIKDYSVDLKDMVPKTRKLLCSCATGAATANAEITGVLLKDVLALADVTEDVNTVALKSADGYVSKLPLRYALEKDAMIAYQVGGKNIPTGAQLWVPETVAKYFIRNIVDVELLSEETEPEVEGRAEALRAEVCINNSVDGSVFKTGQPLSFEGYADDCGDAIRALEFSLDGGETWTAFETGNATADRWVYWRFSTAVEKSGSYQLSVRARTESGNVTPLAANIEFTVVEDGAVGQA